MAIHLVTDSTADLSPDLVARYGIHVVPLTVHFGDREYRDGIELSSDAFFQLLRTSPHHPRTSQPSPNDFAERYRAISQPGDTIISLHISSALSGTFQSASLAASNMADRTVRVIDTRLVSAALGLVVLAAARAREGGATAGEIEAAARGVAEKMNVLFFVDTLEYLARNGRIGKAQALLGGLLQVKPVLQVADGIISPVDKVRGKARVLPRVLDEMRQRVPAGTPIRVALMHAEAPEEAEAWRVAIAETYPIVETVVSQLGATVGVHAGPGTVGVCFYPA